ncbi:MAG: RluA family pseudouridine synthase [Peptoniphilaceae bacterium]
MNTLDSLNYISFDIEEERCKIREFLNKKNLSSRFIRSSIKNKNIYLNGRLAEKNLLLKTGDKLSIRFEDERSNAEIQYRHLDIIYEDQDILVINKEPGMVTHTAKDDVKDTLLNYVAGYFYKNNIRRKVRFVNRLDRDTSGIVIVAKNPLAHSKIQDQFQKTTDKHYIAIVDGYVNNEKGLIDKAIGLSSDGIRREVRKDGKQAKTEYEIVKRNQEFSVLKVKLITGRTHQIRVHLKDMGHPILGDTLYFKESKLINRQALHCYKMTILHPRSNEKIEFIASYPSDMSFIGDL